MDRTDSSAKTINRRLENVRPAPLLLTTNAGRGDLPAIQRDPDSARGSFQQQPQPTVRPLPTMPLQSTPPSNGTPGSAQSTSSVSRSNLPPLPPPSRPPPPTPSSQARPNHPHATSPDGFRGLPSAANTWVNQHLPADPRPGNPGSRRAISPLPSTPSKSVNHSTKVPRQERVLKQSCTQFTYKTTPRCKSALYQSTTAPQSSFPHR
jgi:mitogen-activated protein kinase kinase kinase